MRGSGHVALWHLPSEMRWSGDVCIRAQFGEYFVLFSYCGLSEFFGFGYCDSKFEFLGS